MGGRKSYSKILTNYILNEFFSSIVKKIKKHKLIEFFSFKFPFFEIIFSHKIKRNRKNFLTNMPYIGDSF